MRAIRQWNWTVLGGKRTGDDFMPPPLSRRSIMFSGHSSRNLVSTVPKEQVAECCRIYMELSRTQPINWFDFGTDLAVSRSQVGSRKWLPSYLSCDVTSGSGRQDSFSLLSTSSPSVCPSVHPSVCLCICLWFLYQEQAVERFWSWPRLDHGHSKVK